MKFRRLPKSPARSTTLSHCFGFFCLWLHFLCILAPHHTLSFCSNRINFLMAHERRVSAPTFTLQSQAVESNTKSPRLSIQLCGDIWFCLSLAAATDAMMVVATFNRGLIHRFHYAVSQRLMFLAAIMSFVVYVHDDTGSEFLSDHAAAAIALSIVAYTLFNLCLDAFERIPPGSPTWEKLSTYCNQTGLFDMGWNRACVYSITVLAPGIFLTRHAGASWSPFIPIFHILFEVRINIVSSRQSFYMRAESELLVCFLAGMQARRTSRYLFLSSPPFFAVICVHWGIIPLLGTSRLALSPSAFALFVLSGRMLLDIHMWTKFRDCENLCWVRREVLVSTKLLLCICAIIVCLEKCAFPVLEYVKAVAVIAFLSGSNVSLLAIAAFNIAH